MKNHFVDIHELTEFMLDKRKGSIPVAYQLLPDYAGMVLYIGIIFDLKKHQYLLSLEWMALGLDAYGDTLQESYSYQFDRLELLIEYLQLKYAIAVTEIPMKFEFDDHQFPNPIKDEAQKSLFEAAWSQFQKDFKEGLFLDQSLVLVYNSLTNE